MRKGRRFLLIAAIALVFTLIVSGGVASAASMGFAGLNDYTSGPLDCTYGDRAGRSFCQNVKAAIPSSNPTVFQRWDTAVYDTDLRTAPNLCNFFVYSGHGRRYDLGQSGGASWHVYAQNTSTRYHGSSHESYASINTTWSELRLGHYGSTDTLRWCAAYTCNWLTNGGLQSNKDAQGYMFEGLHQALGFAGVMFLDSRAGTDFGNYITAGYTIKGSWHTINLVWQAGHDPVISRVFAHSRTATDSWASYNTENLTWYLNMSPELRNQVYLYYDLPVGG